jgi:RimJ/RimL family protein N-acetyltransferase|nr:GNAT family N-acetyltransferase [Kofleriaceae bacterium]
MRVPAPTDRLRFRAWRADDDELAVALWGDAAVARFIAAEVPARAACVARLAREIATAEAHGVQYWPMFRGAGELAGCAGLRPYPREPGVLELGVHLVPACWGHGYAVEAGRAVIAHAFDALGAQALFAGHHPDNTASRAMLARLGFTYTHDERYPPTGRMHPSYRLERSR